MAKIIVFEGADRCGKATQSALLKQHLESKGKIVALVEVPIRDHITYPTIYWMLKNGLAKKFPKLFQWLQCHNRLIFQWTKLEELDRQCEFIIFDRWSLSSVVYGVAEGVDAEYCNLLYKKLRKPDFTILLLGQAYAHQAEDVYEADFSLQQKVRDLYAAWASCHSEESHVLDGTNVSKEKVAEEVVKVLQSWRVIPT